MTADPESRVTRTMADQDYAGGSIDEVLRLLQPKNVVVPPKTTQSEPEHLAGEYVPNSVLYAATSKRAPLLIEHPRYPLSDAGLGSSINNHYIL